MNHCKSCGAPILWVRTEAGASMPLNLPAQPRIVLVPSTGAARVMDTYASHFASCPNATEHRKKKP